ncbi:MAG: hypothetical protein IKP69_00150, partial [Oscillospiraceae bacterium]|nr:hypothetical protein [Oscillospiraceae bacterium]
EKEFTAPKHEHKNWWGFWDETEESVSDEDEQPAELSEEDAEAETEEEQDAENIEKEFTAPKYEYKNWWSFWDETEDTTSDEGEQLAELSEDTETEEEQLAELDESTENEEETSLTDWLFDEYFNINCFKKYADEYQGKDTPEEQSPELNNTNAPEFKKDKSSCFDWNTHSWYHKDCTKTEMPAENADEETIELTEEETTETIYVLDVQ